MAARGRVRTARQGTRHAVEKDCSHRRCSGQPFRDRGRVRAARVLCARWFISARSRESVRSMARSVRCDVLASVVRGISTSCCVAILTAASCMRISARSSGPFRRRPRQLSSASLASAAARRSSARRRARSGGFAEAPLLPGARRARLVLADPVLLDSPDSLGSLLQCALGVGGRGQRPASEQGSERQPALGEIGDLIARRGMRGYVEAGHRTGLLERLSALLRASALLDKHPEGLLHLGRSTRW